MLQFSVFESHNSIGVSEKYHDPLRRVYSKTAEEHPTIEHPTILRLALKGFHATIGPSGLVSTLLLFGSLPSLPAVSSTLPKQHELMLALRSARDEMAQYATEQRIIRTLKSKLPPASSYKLTPGDLVRVFMEGPRKWLGPVEVLKVKNKLVHVSNVVKVESFTVTQVMPISIGHRAVDNDLHHLFEHNDKVAEGVIVQQEEQQIQLTEILQKDDPGSQNSKSKAAVQR